MKKSEIFALFHKTLEEKAADARIRFSLVGARRVFKSETLLLQINDPIWQEKVKGLATCFAIQKKDDHEIDVIIILLAESQTLKITIDSIPRDRRWSLTWRNNG